MAKVVPSETKDLEFSAQDIIDIISALRIAEAAAFTVSQESFVKKKIRKNCFAAAEAFGNLAVTLEDWEEGIDPDGS